MLFRHFYQINLFIINHPKSYLKFYQLHYMLHLSDTQHQELYILVRKKCLMQQEGQVQEKKDLKIQFSKLKN